MTHRVEQIRQAEREYHEACYEQYALFEAGSWLHKPVGTVMEAFEHFAGVEEVVVLDLGCGVGRNTIPLAQQLQARRGKVVGVDILESALERLVTNSEKYGVRERIEVQLSDIGEYRIPEQAYDFIVAVSALEHVRSEQDFMETLAKIARGTKPVGIACIIMNTNIEEVCVDSGQSLEPYMELNLSTGYAQELLGGAFSDWEMTYTTVKPLSFEIERSGRKVLLKGDCLTYVVRNSQ